MTTARPRGRRGPRTARCWWHGQWVARPVSHCATLSGAPPEPFAADRERASAPARAEDTTPRAHPAPPPRRRPSAGRPPTHCLWTPAAPEAAAAPPPEAAAPPPAAETRRAKATSPHHDRWYWCRLLRSSRRHVQHEPQRRQHSCLCRFHARCCRHSRSSLVCSWLHQFEAERRTPAVLVYPLHSRHRS